MHEADQRRLIFELDFVILESSPEAHIQTASRDGGYMLEMRDGDRLRHYQAVRRDAVPASANSSSCVFTLEEVLAAFMAYGSEAPALQFLKWELVLLPV